MCEHSPQISWISLNFEPKSYPKHSSRSFNCVMNAIVHTVNISVLPCISSSVGIQNLHWTVHWSLISCFEFIGKIYCSTSRKLHRNWIENAFQIRTRMYTYTYASLLKYVWDEKSLEYTSTKRIICLISFFVLALHLTLLTQTEKTILRRHTFSSVVFLEVFEYQTDQDSILPDLGFSRVTPDIISNTRTLLFRCKIRLFGKHQENISPTVNY